MSTWNYRIVQYSNGKGYGLHEVYYDDNGVEWGMTAEPCSFVADLAEGPQAIIDALFLARTSARKRPVLVEPNKWLGVNPALAAKEKGREPFGSQQGKDAHDANTD